MSTSGITSSILSQIVSSPSSANQFSTDLTQLAQDLQSGNLSAAQDDYVTLSEDAQTDTTSTGGTTSESGITTGLLANLVSSSTSSNSFASELNQLGSDLQNGDLTSAQEDMLSLDSSALNAASADSASSTGSGKTASSTTSVGHEGASELIHAIVQAWDAGDSSAASASLLELASISPSSEGASYLHQLGESLTSGSSSLTSSSSISQLLQGLDTSNSNSSQSILSVLA